MATGGADGNVRIWNTSKLLKVYGAKLDEEILDFSENKSEPKYLDKVEPELKIKVTAEEVDDLDVSLSGEVLATISGNNTVLWNIKNGEKFMELPEIPKIATAKVILKYIFFKIFIKIF